MEYWDRPSEVTTIRITPRQKAYLDYLKEFKGVGMTDVIRRLLEVEVDQYKETHAIPKHKDGSDRF